MINTRLTNLQNSIRRLDNRLKTLNAISNQLSLIRLGIFVVGFVLVLAAFYTLGIWFSWATVAVLALVFGVVAFRHGRIKRSITRHRIWVSLKKAQIARLNLDWPEVPPARIQPTVIDHPFETDLDLTGYRSLHQLLDTATSYEGSQRLANWLLATSPNYDQIQHRQALVKELSPLVNFRERLNLVARLSSHDLSGNWEGQRLLDWLNKKVPIEPLRISLLQVGGLAALTIILFVLNRFAGLPPIWLATFLIYFLVYSNKGDYIRNLSDDAFFLQDGLAKLQAILKYLETYRYGKHTNLQKLCEPFLDAANRPSVRLREVTRVASGAAIQRSQIVGFIINLIVPWDLYFAYRLEQSKEKIASVLPTWLHVWFELEALNSLANFSYLHPEYNFPHVSKSEVFEATQLGHPLIASDKKVSNDFKLDDSGEVVIITGSNMAGKSSFLRTLGVNLCLSYAGGPVDAVCLETGLFRVFSCIKVSDSVADGYSYFYAEVRRLKKLLLALKQDQDLPLFFLIDEIFRGTNNRERLVGSRSYLKALVGENGVGFVSTHDLELVKLADEMNQIKNYHFREEVIDGQMIFDYKLRHGPCPTTNALKIMQMEGLPVDAADLIQTKV